MENTYLDEYAIYLRKSRSDIEAEAMGEGETLARHEKALISLAEKQKIKISKIYREIVSGETIASRPEMQALLSDTEKGLWKGVLVMEVERLARGETIDQGVVAQTFKYSGTKIITPMKIYDPDNEFDEEYFEFGLFMSRREYKTINRRLQSGRLASVQEGKYVGSSPPYGYKRMKLTDQKGYTLEPVSGEADAIKLIFELYAHGEQQKDGTIGRLGPSLIARRLNQLKIKPRRSDAWTAPTIRDILNNPVYVGKIRWNWRPAKKKMENGKVVKERPKSKDAVLIEGLHEPIIADKTFDLAQELMTKKSVKPVTDRHTIKNPLAGIVKCGVCDRNMIRRPYNDKTKHDTLMCPAPHCKNVSARLSSVEDAVLDALNMVLSEYQVQLGTNSEPDEIKLRVIGNNINELKNKLQELRKQLDKVHELLETGVYSPGQFLERSGLMVGQIKEYEEDLSNLEIKHNEEELRIESKVEFVPRLENILAIYKEVPTAQGKNDLLKEILEKVVYVKEKSARYKGVNPDDFTITVYPALGKRSV